MSEKRQRILEEWNTYREMVIPPNAPEIQLKEMRRAFFAGASMCFTLMVNKSDDQDAGLQLLTDIDEEFRSFAERTKTGAV